MTENGPPPSPTPPPPGWYDDPWGESPKRWWDGTEWTHHRSDAGSVPTGPPGPAPAASLDAERASARWARGLMPWGGVAQAASAVTSALLFQELGDTFRESVDSGDISGVSGGNPTVSLISNVASMLLLAVGIVFLIWFYRALTVAAESGLPAKRGPGLGVAGFLIPIVNFWWPYRSMVDAMPAGHPAQPLILRWWLLYIAMSVLTIGVVVGALFSTAVMWILAIADVGVSLAGAFAARDVIDAVTAAHTTIRGENPS